MIRSDTPLPRPPRQWVTATGEGGLLGAGLSVRLKQQRAERSGPSTGSFQEVDHRVTSKTENENEERRVRIVWPRSDRWQGR